MGKLFLYRKTWPFAETKEATLITINDEAYLAAFITHAKQAETIIAPQDGVVYILTSDAKAADHWEAWEFGNFIRRIGSSPNRCALAVQQAVLERNICDQGWDAIDKTRSFTKMMP